MIFTDAAGARHIGPPIRFRNEPPRPNPRVPEYGEDSRSVAADAGLGPHQIADLTRKGTI